MSEESPEKAMPRATSRGRWPLPPKYVKTIDSRIWLHSLPDNTIPTSETNQHEASSSRGPEAEDSPIVWLLKWNCFSTVFGSAKKIDVNALCRSGNAVTVHSQ